MRSVHRFLTVFFFLIFLMAVPALAQQNGSSSPSVHIVGVVQSFSGNILDVKPPTTPAVWVTIPADLRVDRSALKEGVGVSVEAYWDVATYIAKEVTVEK